MTPGELLATRQGPAGGDRTTGASGTAATAETGQQALLEQFQGLLQQEGTLASDDRDELVRVFENALQDAAASNGQAASNAFDTATWHETVDMLRQGGFVEQDEADHLIRSLNEALAPLQRRESQLAMEFSRRVETEGQEKALEWFREASKASQEASGGRDTVAPTPDKATVTPLRADTVNSRSRRLRGPPGAR